MVGSQFDFQNRVQGQRGGMIMRPLGGVISGLLVTDAKAVTGTTTSMSFDVSAGQARIDGVVHTLGSAINDITFANAAGGADLASAAATLNIYLNPQRKIPAATSNPSSPTSGDKYIKVVDMGDYHVVDSFLTYNGSAWVAFDPVSEPPGIGHNNLPLNELGSTTISSTANVSLSLNPEKPIYHKVGQPLYIAAPANACLRYSASILLATVTFAGGSATIKTYADGLRLPL